MVIRSLVVSVDVTDISGELQTDLHHDVVKTRLNADGTRHELPGSNGTKTSFEGRPRFDIR